MCVTAFTSLQNMHLLDALQNVRDSQDEYHFLPNLQMSKMSLGQSRLA